MELRRSTPTSFARLCAVLVVGMMALLTTATAQAAVEEGTVISSDNLDELRNQKFEGQTIDQLLTRYHEKFIEEYGAEIRLSHGYDWKLDSEWKQAAQYFSDDTELNGDGLLQNWEAGLPFPDVSMGDENAGMKIAWNYFVGEPKGYIRDHGQLYVNFQDMTTEGNGWNRYWYATQLHAYLQGLYGFDVTENTPKSKFQMDDEIYRKFYSTVLYPQSRKGVGTFFIKYFDGRFSDQWAYLRSVRRVRRLAGGSWTDPIAGVTNWAGDDQNIWSGHPMWYPKFEILGKVTRLAPICRNIDCRNDLHNPDGATIQDRVRPFAVQTPGKANWFYDPRVMDFTPRTMYKIRMEMPPIHMYSKRIIYFDTEAWYAPYAFVYDKRGDFWKGFSTTRAVVEGPEGQIGQIYTSWYGANFKTLANEGGGVSAANLNPEWLSHKDITLSALRRGASLRP